MAAAWLQPHRIRASRNGVRDPESRPESPSVTRSHLPHSHARCHGGTQTDTAIPRSAGHELSSLDETKDRTIRTFHTGTVHSIDGTYVKDCAPNWGQPRRRHGRSPS